MRRVTVAAGSQISAEAGAGVADHGGNAIDAAVAAALVSLCTEPGLVAPAASGFITVWPAGGDPVVIDAYAEMPGRDAPPERFGGGAIDVEMAYGGGMTTIVGYGSVATPGAFAGLGLASERFGALPWPAVVEPAIDWAERGFPLPMASAEYFAYAAEPIFGWHPDSRAVIHHPDGTRLAAGERMHVPHLEHSLRLLAEQGAASFYTGTLGRQIAHDVAANGGLLTATDLAEYEAVARQPIVVELDDWTVAANPPPAIGGATMAAMVMLLDRLEFRQWDASTTSTMVDVQAAVLDYRRHQLDGTTDVAGPVAALLEHARLGELGALLASPSTIHVSAVDSDGNACATTMSAGYGSGVMVPGTGLWLNNSLGEVELHPEGYHALPPGTRLPSNMAPTVARRADGAVLAIGSPGADRITTAITQVLVNFVHLNMALTEAVEHPRLHVEVFDGEPTVAFEPGVPVTRGAERVLRPFPDLSMYFGGVQAAMWDPRAGLFGAADPRRAGAVARGG